MSFCIDLLNTIIVFFALTLTVQVKGQQTLQHEQSSSTVFLILGIMTVVFFSLMAILYDSSLNISKRKNSEEWNKERKKFKDYSTKWHNNKKKWLEEQKQREELEKKWKELVDKQTLTLNILTLGITHVTGITKDHQEIERCLRNMKFTKSTIEFADQSKEFLSSLNEARRQLLEANEEICREREALLSEREKLGKQLTFFRSTSQASSFSSKEISSCEIKIKACDEKLDRCNIKLDEIGEDIKKCEHERESVIREIKSCRQKLHLSKRDIETCQERVMRCIEELKSLSSKYTKIIDKVSNGALAGGGGAVVLTAVLATGPAGWIIGTATAGLLFAAGISGKMIQNSVSEAKERLEVCENDLKNCDDIALELQNILDKCIDVLSKLEQIIEDN